MPIDIDQSHYADGTASVSSFSTTVTGQGTTWLGAIRPGDLFGTQYGLSVRILSIESNTELTLAYPWQGPSQTEGAYEIQRTPYDLGYHQATEELLLLLGGGNLEAFAGIEGANGRIPYFTGAGTMSYLTQEDLVSGVAFDVQVDTLPERDAYDGEPEGFAVLVSDTGDGRAALYTRVGASGWSDPAYITGPSITLDVGTITPVAFDDDPDVTITALGDGEYELNFDLPVAADISVGTTTTIAPGEPAAVTVTPTATGYELDFDIPTGGLRFLGAYDGGTTYIPGDVVTFNGSSYVNIDESTGQEPTDTDYWDLLAAQGATGSLDGVTVFWQGVLESSEDAAAARTELGLGSAAVEDAGVFATSAQGALADSAVQPADVADVLRYSAQSLSSGEQAQARENIGLADGWAVQPIGVPIPVWDHLTGVSLPPTDQAYRYVLLTAGEDGSGEYNEGVLTGESVSGSAPDINATAVVNLSGSPLNGQTLRLINSTREILKAGSSGTIEGDAIRNITGSLNQRNWNGNSLLVLGGTGALNASGPSGSQNGTASQSNSGGQGTIDFDASAVVPTAAENRPRNIGATYVMRIL